MERNEKRFRVRHQAPSGRGPFFFMTFVVGIVFCCYMGRVAVHTSLPRKTRPLPPMNPTTTKVSHWAAAFTPLVRNHPSAHLQPTTVRTLSDAPGAFQRHLAGPPITLPWAASSSPVHFQSNSELHRKAASGLSKSFAQASGVFFILLLIPIWAGHAVRRFFRSSRSRPGASYYNTLALLGDSAATASAPPLPKRTLADEVRADFPLLEVEVHPNVPLIYLDSAATSQKPKAVLEALDQYYRTMNSNVHRGAHTLGNRATEAYEAARAKVACFIKAPGGCREIVFTRGATEAINLVAQTWGIQELRPGDEVLLSVMEHHANLVPWQLVAAKTGAVLKFVRLTEEHTYDLEHFQSLLSSRTKLVALAHVSNVLGCVNPVRDVVAAAKAVGARVLLDACQSVPHMPVDVAALGVDWLVASGHKMCGPTGIGFLWGRYDVLEAMPPWQGGGEMIDEVFLDHSTWAHAPGKFEAGTPAIAQAVGLGAACDYLSGIGMERIQEYEHQLAEYLWLQLKTVDDLVLYGPPPSADAPRAALLAFNCARGSHSLDLLTFLDLDGVAIRSGHHCTQPLHRELGRSSSARASLYIYNTFDEVDKFVASLRSSLAMLRA